LLACAVVGVFLTGLAVIAPAMPAAGYGSVPVPT
jgi:hypothetical protein